MRPLLLALTALLVFGCASPESREVIRYLKVANGYEQSLADFKLGLARIPTLKPEERDQAFHDLSWAIQDRRANLEKEKVPPAAQALHTALLGLFDSFQRYVGQAAHATGQDDPELKSLAADWQQRFKVAEAEMDKLSARFQ